MQRDRAERRVRRKHAWGRSHSYCEKHRKAARRASRISRRARRRLDKAVIAEQLHS